MASPISPRPLLGMGGGGGRWRGGGGGWLEQLGIKLISTQVVVEVEVGVELGKNYEKKPWHQLSSWGSFAGPFYVVKQ